MISFSSERWGIFASYLLHKIYVRGFCSYGSVFGGSFHYRIGLLDYLDDGFSGGDLTNLVILWLCS